MLGVSRAAYYKRCNRVASVKQQNDEKLAQHINEIYQSQHGIPGYRQMKIILERRFGFKCNLKRVRRLMNVLGLRSVCRRKKRKRPKKTSAEYIEENILNREFSACGPNEKWLTDVRVGCCLDNAPMEGFWGILKSEMYYPNRFDDYDSLYEAVSEYIDFYNHVRYQKKLDCMTPAEFILATTV